MNIVEQNRYCSLENLPEWKQQWIKEAAAVYLRYYLYSVTKPIWKRIDEEKSDSSVIPFFLLAFISFFISSQIIPHYSTWFCPYCLPQPSPVLVSFTPEDPTLDSHSASYLLPVPTYMFSPRSTAHMPVGPALSQSRLQTLRAGTIDLLPSRICRRQNGRYF